MEKAIEALLGLSDIQVTQVEVNEGEIVVHCESKLAGSHCPVCLEKCHFVKQRTTRKVRDLSITGKKVYLELTTRQFVCQDCKRHFYEQFSFVDKKESVTIRYGQRLYELCQGIELQYVVLQEDICWQSLHRIFRGYAKKAVQQSKAFSEVKRIGIDEIALKKGHKDYVAVVVDLDTGGVLDILPERSKDYLINYFKKKGEAFCARIELFCSDMWEGYLNCAKEIFANAVIVADRFHFFSHLQKALDACRKYLRRKYKDESQLKNIKWLLLKNPGQLTKEEKKQLEQVFAQADYRLLQTIYEAKNGFRAILEQDLTVEQAEVKLQKWIEKIKGHRFMEGFIKFYATWKKYILNYFQGRYTTGIIEGINNKIKSIKRRAFGFTNFDNFKLRIQTAFC